LEDSDENFNFFISAVEDSKDIRLQEKTEAIML